MNQASAWQSWRHQPPHLLIRASAGSGKTYQLSSRYLGLLHLGAEPESILATTFTRKAAGEVLARIITRLADAVNDPAKREELATSLPGQQLSRAQCLTMLRRLTGSMHRLSIMTIDSFFSRIARCFAYELDLPPEPEMVDDKHPLIRQLRRDAIEAMLADSDLHELVTLLRQFHHNHAARRVTDAITDIISDTHETYREAPEADLWSKLKPVGLLDEDALRTAIEAFIDIAHLLPDNGHWRNGYALNRDALFARDWDNFCKKGIASSIIEGKEKFQRIVISDEIRFAMSPLIDHAKAALIERVALQTRATHDLLKRFDVHDNELRRRRGVLLFTDPTHKLARELTGPAAAQHPGVIDDIYFRLDDRVTHLLLDEFQDTSVAQWDVLRPFAEQVAATADGSRSLFIVGDTKQAIYGWRGGVAELFDQIENELNLEGDSVQTMARSYRSSGDVLDVVNRVFSKLQDNAALDKDHDTAKRWSQAYTPHTAAQDLPGHVTLESSTASSPDEPDTQVFDNDDDGDTPQHTAPGAHERYVAMRVKQLYERPGGAGSIGVLVRTNQAASKLIYEIALLGLPVSAEGGAALTDTPAVLAVLSALNMADHPGDSASAFHVFNSPLAKVVGLSSIDDADVIRASRRIRQTLLAHGYAQTLADWTRAVAGDCDARGMARLTQLTELADSFDPAEALRPSRFVELVGTQRIAEPSTAPIRVMTVHSSKGLEFDTIVLAELDKPFRDSTELLVERDHPTGPVTGVYRNANQDIRSLDPRLERAAEVQRASRLTDDLCTLYVAMTRARQALHMIAKPRKQNKNGTLRSRGLCDASILCDALGQVEETSDGEQRLFEHGDPAWPCNRKTPAPPTSIQDNAPAIDLHDPSQSARRFMPTVLPSQQVQAHRSARNILDISRDSSEAMRYGTLIHAWFECVGFMDEDPPPDDDRLLGLAKRLIPGASAAWLDARITHFRRILETDMAARVLSRQGAAELWSERRFVITDKRELMRGSFDRVAVYRDAQGRPTRAVLTDFKTDRPGPGGTAELTDHYRPQVLAYGRALRRMLNLPADAVQMQLWFIGADELAAIDWPA